MNLLRKEDIKELVYNTEGFVVESENETQIEVFDEVEDRFLTYRYPETINFKELFQFNSTVVNQELFFNVVRECVDLNMFMIVNKIVFINDPTEMVALDNAYPEQYMDIEEAIGIHYHSDSVVVINVYKLKELARELSENSSESVELAHGIWTTLVHELRHVITTNPIIPDTLIPTEEESEENVENYCRVIFEEKIEKHPDFECFSMNVI